MAFSPSNKTTINSFPFFKLYYKHELIIMQSKRFCDFFFKLKPTFHSNVCQPCHQAHKCFKHVHGCPTTNHSDTTIGEKKVRASY